MRTFTGVVFGSLPCTCPIFVSGGVFAITVSSRSLPVRFANTAVHAATASVMFCPLASRIARMLLRSAAPSLPS